MPHQDAALRLVAGAPPRPQASTMAAGGACSYSCSKRRTPPHTPLSASNGAVIATEKKMPSVLVDDTSIRKVRGKQGPGTTACACSCPWRAPRPLTTAGALPSGGEAHKHHRHGLQWHGPRQAVCCFHESAFPGRLSSRRALSFLPPHLVSCLPPRPLFSVLLAKGRKLAQQYYLTYHEPIPTRMLTQQLAGVMQEYTQKGCVRGISWPQRPRRV